MTDTLPPQTVQQQQQLQYHHPFLRYINPTGTSSSTTTNGINNSNIPSHPLLPTTTTTTTTTTLMNNTSFKNSTIDTYYDNDNDEYYLNMLYAGAFKSLLQHLQYYSNDISNLDMMTISGFCRNCLAKWMVLEARRLVDEDNDTKGVQDGHNNKKGKEDKDVLYNTFGIDDAMHVVYGIPYEQWKQIYMKPATSDQLIKYQSSTSIHAQHDKNLLSKRTTTATSSSSDSNTTTVATTTDKVTSTSTTNTTTTAATDTIQVISTIQQEPSSIPNTMNIVEQNDIDDYDDHDHDDHEDVQEVVDVTTPVDSIKMETAVQKVVVEEVVVSVADPSSSSLSTNIPSWFAARTAATKQDVPKPPTFRSNVCCVDIDEEDHDIHEHQENKEEDIVLNKETLLSNNDVAPANGSTHESVPSVLPLALPDITQYKNQQFPVIAIVTISDRAYAGIYEDMSGPMVAATLQQCIQSHQGGSGNTTNENIQFVQNIIVPDDMAAIQAKLHMLIATHHVDCILTTGGTGFGIRDVTPEATRNIIDYEIHSLLPYCYCSTNTAQPFSSSSPTSTLSRGIVGVCSGGVGGDDQDGLVGPASTLICNLPGSPTSIQEVVPLILPYLLHIIVQIQHITPEILHIG